MFIIIALLSVLILLVAGSFYLAYRKIRSIQATFTAFITPADEKTPSPLAKTTEIFSDMVARSIMAQAKTFMMGLQSGQKRAETALQGDIVDDMANQSGNPLGAVLSSFPAVKKTLRRNPQLMDMALSYLSKRAGNNPAGNNHNAEQVKFKL